MEEDQRSAEDLQVDEQPMAGLRTDELAFPEEYSLEVPPLVHTAALLGSVHTGLWEGRPREEDCKGRQSWEREEGSRDGPIRELPQRVEGGRRGCWSWTTLRMAC